MCKLFSQCIVNIFCGALKSRQQQQQHSSSNNKCKAAKCEQIIDRSLSLQQQNVLFSHMDKDKHERNPTSSHKSPTRIIASSRSSASSSSSSSRSSKTRSQRDKGKS
ncbi:hypothetical protein CVS40_0348 [Lucilia cuprina]|nr:hypothetical protein CVS40_0348 [Lucilia cuprina]